MKQQTFFNNSNLFKLINDSVPQTIISGLHPIRLPQSLPSQLSHLFKHAVDLAVVEIFRPHVVEMLKVEQLDFVHPISTLAQCTSVGGTVKKYQ